MGWIYATSRPWGRQKPVDADDTEDPVNGFLCDAEVQAFKLRCPACGAPHEIRASDRHSPVFDRRRQRFQCGRCRFGAAVYLTVDCGFAPDEPEPQAQRTAAP